VEREHRDAQRLLQIKSKEVEEMRRQMAGGKEREREEGGKGRRPVSASARLAIPDAKTAKGVSRPVSATTGGPKSHR
jgi:hypothetical protein